MSSPLQNPVLEAEDAQWQVHHRACQQALSLATLLSEAFPPPRQPACSYGTMWPHGILTFVKHRGRVEGRARELRIEFAWLQTVQPLYPSVPRLWGLFEACNGPQLCIEVLAAGDLSHYAGRPEDTTPGWREHWRRTGTEALKHLYERMLAHNHICLHHLSYRHDDGQCIILDWSSASLCFDQVAQASGCSDRRYEPYMAPERCACHQRDKVVDLRLCDLFAFGVACLFLETSQKSWKRFMWSNLDTISEVQMQKQLQQAQARLPIGWRKLLELSPMQRLSGVCTSTGAETHGLDRASS